MQMAEQYGIHLRNKVMLMTKFKYGLSQVDKGVSVVLSRIVDNSLKNFYLVNTSVDIADHIEKIDLHMKTLTDSQCNDFFDDGKSKEASVKEFEVPDFSTVKGLSVVDGKCFVAKKGKPQEVTAEVFHAELMKRFGKGSANKWLEEHKVQYE